MKWRKLRDETPPAGRLLKLNVDGGTVASGFMYSGAPGILAVFTNAETQKVYPADMVDAWALQHEDAPGIDAAKMMGQPAPGALDVILDPARHLPFITARACECQTCKSNKTFHVTLGVAGVSEDEIPAFISALEAMLRANYNPPAPEKVGKPCKAK